MPCAHEVLRPLAGALMPVARTQPGVCAACHGAAAAPGELTKSFSALRVEGAVRHPEQGGECEFSVVLAIVNERGEEVSRQVVGVGALRPSESRTFRLSVDVHTRDQKPR